MLNRLKWHPKKAKPKPRSREELAAQHGDVYDTAELARSFIVTAIINDQIVVRRKSDNLVGTMRYQDRPRLYFGFQPQAFQDN